MTQFWDKQIQRADHLAKQSSGSIELLAFYGQLLRAQKEIYEFLRSRKNWLPSGDLEADLPVITQALPDFLRVIQAHGPEPLAVEATELLTSNASVIGGMVMKHWRHTSDM